MSAENILILIPINIHLHELSHILGICGEKHFSLLGLVNEWPNLEYIFTYLKYKIKNG